MEKPMPCRPRGVSRHVAVLGLSHCGEHDAVGCLEGFGVSSDHGEAVPQHGSDRVPVIHFGTLSLFKDPVSKGGHPFGCCDFSSWVLGFVLQPCVGVTHAPLCHQHQPLCILGQQGRSPCAQGCHGQTG